MTCKQYTLLKKASDTTTVCYVGYLIVIFDKYNIIFEIVNALTIFNIIKLNTFESK